MKSIIVLQIIILLVNAAMEELSLLKSAGWDRGGPPQAGEVGWGGGGAVTGTGPVPTVTAHLCPLPKSPRYGGISRLPGAVCTRAGGHCH